MLAMGKILTYSGRSTDSSLYWALVTTRNRSEMLQQTLNSILSQTIPPSSICVVNDGSIDDTPLILEQMMQRNPEKIIAITLKDKGYDIRRVVKNLNLGLKAMEEKESAAEYVMISGDDCIYPQEYSERILERMNRNQNIKVASGDIEGLNPDAYPRGPGRFIRSDFLREIGGYFPPYYGYEGWIYHKALQLGYSVENFSDIRYRHLCEMGRQHKFTDWGLSMKCLGYNPFEVIIRCFKYPLIDRRVSVGYMRVLFDYFIYSLVAKAKRDPYYQFFDEDFRTYMAQKQKHSLIYRARHFARARQLLGSRSANTAKIRLQEAS